MMSKRVPLLGHDLIVISGGPGTRATVAGPECRLREASADAVTQDGNAWVGARAPLDDFVRAAVLAGRVLAGLQDPSCEGVSPAEAGRAGDADVSS